MKNVLVTGGSGFFGSLLKEHCLNLGWHVVNIDLEKDEMTQPNLTSYQGDIRDTKLMTEIFEKHGKFDAVFHCAAILAHAVKDKKFLWQSNVNGTNSIAEFAKKYNVPKVIFTSSNCLWGEGFNRPLREDDAP